MFRGASRLGYLISERFPNERYAMPFAVKLRPHIFDNQPLVWPSRNVHIPRYGIFRNEPYLNGSSLCPSKSLERGNILPAALLSVAHSTISR
jgi:hypothetical protein